MSTFTWKAPKGVSVDQTHKVRKAEFGDGYSQVAPVGLNSSPRVWDFSYSKLDDYTATQIQAFIVAVGTASFTWVGPDQKTGRYRCDGIKRTYDDDDENTLSLKFTEVFA